VRADTGDEGGVIFDSSIALLQGLYPPTTAQNTTLANGTNVVGPLGGYQFVPIESVEAAEDVSLEGHASCTTWNQRVTNLYSSQIFMDKAAQAAPFLAAVKPFLDNRTVTLQNMYNIYDFLNVQSLHNATFLKELPSGYLAQATDLANWHEWLLFTDPAKGGIGNIAGYTIIPSMISGLQAIANASNPLKIHYSAISYKPFISLFNMTAVSPPTSNANDILSGIVGYASSMVLEVVNGTSTNGTVSVRMLFKNGTNDPNYLPLSGGVMGSSGLVKLSDFIGAIQPQGVNNTLAWCNACSNHVDRGCAAYFSNNNASSAGAIACKSQKVSDVGAGFIGASVTLALVLGLLGVGTMLGLLHFGKKKPMTKMDSDKGSQ